jgi:hypothetical protein
LPIQLHHKYEENKPCVVTKEVPKLRGSQLSIKLKLKIAITSFFSAVMSLHLGSARLHMRSPVPGGSGKFCMIMHSRNTLEKISRRSLHGEEELWQHLVATTGDRDKCGRV